MKTSKIYVVGSSGVGLALSGGSYAVAFYPAGKGDKESVALLSNGQFCRIKGNRIQGVGAARFVEEQGMVLAQPGNLLAEKLADHLDARDGLKLVEEAGSLMAKKITQQYDGQARMYVPFDPSKEPEVVTIKNSQSTVVIFDMVSGMSKPGIYTNGHSTISIADGWLVDANRSVDALPRNTEYGGIVEHAVFMIHHFGMAKLSAETPNLETNDDPLFPKGRMDLLLENGDQVIIGIDAGDELCVQYISVGTLLYSRQGLPGGNRGPRLSDAVGAIGAVFVRVKEMVAVPVKAKRTKKAA